MNSLTLCWAHSCCRVANSGATSRSSSRPIKTLVSMRSLRPLILYEPAYAWRRIVIRLRRLESKALAQLRQSDRSLKRPGRIKDNSVSTFEAGEIRLEIALVETGSFSVGFPESGQVRALNGLDLRGSDQSTRWTRAIDKSQRARSDSTREPATQLDRFVARQDLLDVNRADAKQNIPRRASLLGAEDCRKGHLPIVFDKARHIGGGRGATTTQRLDGLAIVKPHIDAQQATKRLSYSGRGEIWMSA